MSQFELSRRTQVRQSVISGIENGKRVVGVGKMMRICAELQLELVAVPLYTVRLLEQLCDSE